MTGVLGVVIIRLEAEEGIKLSMVVLTVFWWVRVESEFNLV